jgi:hypothetical protein
VGRKPRNKVTHFLGGACTGLQPHFLRMRARVDDEEEKAGGGVVAYPGVERSTDYQGL